MASWYTVERGFITCDIYFDTEAEAELYCLAMCAITGDMWHTRRNFGYSARAEHANEVARIFDLIN